MINKKVTKVLSCFSPEDKKQFKKFLRSEYHTSDPTLLSLYEFILTNIDSAKYTLDIAFQHTFPNEKFSLKKINNKCSDLSLHAEEFLVCQEIKKNKFYKEKLLNKAYEERENPEHSEPRFKRLAKALNSTPKDEIYYLHQTELLLTHYFSSATKKFNFKKSEKIYTELRTCINTLICLLNISMAIEDIARSRFYNKEYKETIINPVLALAQTIPNPILQLYHLGFLLVRNEELPIFKEFKVNFFQSREELSRSAKNTFSAILLNYSTRNVNKKLDRHEVLELSKTIVEGNLLEIDGYFPAAYFSNICIMSTEVNTPKLTLDLLEFGQKRLHPKDKENTLAKCWAYHYFSLGEYKLALKEIHKVPQSAINYRLQVSALELKCLYEEHLTGESTIFEHRHEAFKKILYRNKSLHDSFKEQNMNFLKIITKLHNSVSLSNKTRTTLLQEVNTYSKIVAREWLIQKIKNHA